jgi:hypothetical protein
MSAAGILLCKKYNFAVGYGYAYECAMQYFD